MNTFPQNEILGCISSNQTAATSLSISLPQAFPVSMLLFSNMAGSQFSIERINWCWYSVRSIHCILSKLTYTLKHSHTHTLTRSYNKHKIITNDWNSWNRVVKRITWWHTEWYQWVKRQMAWRQFLVSLRMCVYVFVCVCVWWTRKFSYKYCQKLFNDISWF